MRLAGSLLLLCLAPLCVAAQSRATNQAAPPILLRDAHVSSTVRREIAAVVVENLREDDTRAGAADALGFFVEFPSLAEDGRGTISVQASCDFAGQRSAALWLFQIKAGHASLILYTDAKGFGPWSKAFHNGMRDFQTSVSFDGKIGTEVFRFDGARYRSAYCETTAADDNGLWRFRRTKCNPR